MRFPLLRVLVLSAFCWLLLSKVVRAEEITISLDMGFDKVVEAIQKAGGIDPEHAPKYPSGHTWMMNDYGVYVDIEEHYGKLSYLVYSAGGRGVGPAALSSVTYDNMNVPLESLTFDTEQHKIRVKELPPTPPGPAPSDPEWLVSVELLVVAMPQDRALALLPGLSDLHDARKVDAAYAQIMAAIQRKEVRLIGCPVIRTKHGIQATSETVDRKGFPSPWEPPTVAQNMGAASVKPEEAATAKKEEATVGLADLLPKSVEIYNFGVMLEVEPFVDAGGQWLSLSYQSQHVEFDGMEIYEVLKGVQGFTGRIQQPRVYTNKDRGLVKIRNGQRMLVGVHKSLHSDDMEIHLIRATTTPAPSR